MSKEQAVTGSAQVYQFECDLPVFSRTVSPMLNLFLNIDHENIVTECEGSTEHSMFRDPGTFLFSLL
jgi:hypothetical protein